MVGHTLTAAGAIEAVFSLLTLDHQRIPPTINYQMPDPAIPLDVVPNKARDAKVERVISNSFGFGGQNVCLVMTRRADVGPLRARVDGGLGGTIGKRTQILGISVRGVWR